MGCEEEKLFAALARAAQRRVNQFKPQEFGNTGWAFAMLGQSEEKLFATLAMAAERRAWTLLASAHEGSSSRRTRENASQC